MLLVLVDLESYTSRILPSAFKRRLQVLLNQELVNPKNPRTSPISASTSSAFPVSHLGRVIAEGTPAKRAVPGAVASCSSKRLKVGHFQRNHKRKCLPPPPDGAEVIEISDDEDGGEADRGFNGKDKGKGIDLSIIDSSDNK